ncbi:MAG: DUF1648 domain-containing protein [Chloroflexi bacterium]|nr:DUF1648 domain-containing protein [Chloroflexota bacterium]
MNTRFLHPVWTHFPATGALVVLLAYLAVAGPLPAQVPVHFSWGGSPDRYGSPWAVFGTTAGLSVIYILLSFLLDELWARQEAGKTFNWLSLFDELVVGALSGMGLGYLRSVVAGDQSFTFPWNEVLVVGGGAVALAVLLELVRPFKAQEQRVTIDETTAFAAGLGKRLQAGGAFVYFDVQNPWYMTLLAALLPVVMLAGALLSWSSEPWAAALLAALGVLLFLFNGGQRTAVTREEVRVRYGIPGLTVLRLAATNIASVKLHRFAPLRDFGGYGIRFNREMRAYFLSGNQGVLLTTAGGRKYLIGSNRPERLAAVIRAAAPTRNHE